MQQRAYIVTYSSFSLSLSRLEETKDKGPKTATNYIELKKVKRDEGKKLKDFSDDRKKKRAEPVRELISGA